MKNLPILFSILVGIQTLSFLSAVITPHWENAGNSTNYYGLSNMVAEDVGLVSVDSPNAPFPAGFNPIYVTLINNGTVPLESVTLNLEINGNVESVIDWTGNILPGDTQDSILVDSFQFDIDVLYSLKVWTSNPNGTNDSNNINDTLNVTDLYASMGGVYTIGGISPDFDNLSDAIDALFPGGIYDSVEFNIRDGIYNEQITIPEIPGTDSLNTITFQSESGDSTAVKITYDNASNTQWSTIKMDGADWLRFKHLSLEAKNTPYAVVVEITNGAEHNIFSNNEIIGEDVNSDNTPYSLIYSNNSNDNYNQFTNNNFFEGSYGLYYYGASTNAGFRETGTLINNNSFEGQYKAGINILRQEDSHILHNIISTNSSHTAYYGIYLSNSYNDVRVYGNKISEQPSGIGIYLSGIGSTPGYEAIIANNFIHTLDSYNGQGILINSSSFCKLYHNTVNVNCSPNLTNTFALKLNNCNNINIKNNVFNQQGSGYVINAGNGNNNIASDYNNFYGLGVLFGRWGNVDVATFSEWQIAVWTGF